MRLKLFVSQFMVCMRPTSVASEVNEANETTCIEIQGLDRFLSRVRSRRQASAAQQLAQGSKLFIPECFRSIDFSLDILPISTLEIQISFGRDKLWQDRFFKAKEIEFFYFSISVLGCSSLFFFSWMAEDICLTSQVLKLLGFEFIFAWIGTLVHKIYYKTAASGHQLHNVVKI